MKMTSKNFDTALAPLEDFVSPEEFTNRKQELDFLWSLADKATRRTAWGYAIIARKGMGKTALMLEFYRQLFTQQKQVVPFFVSFAEDKEKPGVVQLTLEKFISKLFVTFAFQYGAFKSGRFSTLPRLPRMVSEQKEFFASFGDPLLEKEFLSHLHALETKDIEGAFDHAIEFASEFTLQRGEAGIVMIDEFQVLTQIYDERYEKFRDITEWFQKPAEARWYPMVVSGSAVSLVIKTVMGGLLSRRFGSYHLDPFDAPHTLEFVYKLSRKEQIKLSEEAALGIHRLTGGNPFYILCFFMSLGLKDKDLSTLKKVEELYVFETTNRDGKMRKFWDDHFNEFADKINDDKIGLQALYQLAVAKKAVRINTVAVKLGVEPEKVRRALKNLERADLIEAQTGSIYPVYHHITDPVLVSYVEREYQVGMSGRPVDAFVKSQLVKLKKHIGSAAWALGEAAELYTRLVMMHFAGQKVDAATAFNLDGGILKLPKFTKVEHRTGLVIRGEVIEFDLLAEGEESWLVEVRYRRKPATLNDVEKFFRKLSKMKGWSRLAGPLREGRRLWFFSRNGFNDEAAARLRELKILHSDLSGFNALCRAVKIGEVAVVD